MKVAAIQMTSGPDVTANLEQARALLEDAAGRGARLAALPENFSFMGRKDADKRGAAEADGSGPAQDFLAASARRLHLWIVGGTIPLRSGADGRVAAASLVYDTDGRRVARYDKIHLFDVDIPGRAHWETLVRARAIENLCYVVAPAQSGFHPSGRETYGDSMIVDYWGRVLQRVPRGRGCAVADVDLARQMGVRESFPALLHRALADANTRP